MRRLLAVITLAFVLLPLGARADVPTKDATLGTYVRYGGANIRIDKIESVAHLDGNPIIKPDAVFPEGGYLIVSVSVQNPGSAEIFMPSFRTMLFLEDQSKVESDSFGPYVGAKTVEAPGRLAPKESIRVRYVVPGWNGTRITKMVLDPNDSTPLLRFQIGATTITPLPETPVATKPE